MSELYRVIGFVTFWLLIVLCLLFVADTVWQLWNSVKVRTWVYQPYEYYRFKKKTVKMDYIPRKEIIQYLIDEFEGKIDSRKYRVNNFFKRQYLKRLHEMLNSDKNVQGSDTTEVK